MPVPSVMTDLSTTATSNSPAGTDPIGSSLDDYLRTIQAIVRREQAQGASIASAGTTNIGANTDGNYIHITGTTAITSFGTVAAGIRRTLVFDGALTLTYNATSMILPGAASITTVAGDVAEFVSEGSGNWRCLRYVKSVSDNLTSAINFNRSTVAATATTTPLWTSPNGNVQDWTSTPTITDFPAAPQAGSQRQVYPAAGTIITNAGNISVQGAANYTFVAGDKATITAVTTTTFYVALEKKDGTAVVPQSVSVPIRQTILSGPVDTNGFASFGGSIGATTVTASGTLIVTAANGYSSTLAAVNRVGAVTNPSWTGLSTNGAMYLYQDIAADGTCTSGSTTLAPTYRWGGADVTTNNQFTFNIQEMVGKVGNGSVATQTYRVFVGEVTVAGGVVTAITWYQLRDEYRNEQATLAVSTAYSFNHNIGKAELLVSRWYECKTTDNGYAVGDRIYESYGDSNGSTAFGGPFWTTGKTCGITIGTGSGVALLQIANKTTGTIASILPGNWKLGFVVKRGW